MLFASVKTQNFKTRGSRLEIGARQNFGENVQKKPLPVFFEPEPHTETAGFPRNLHLFWPRKSHFGGVYLQNWLASLHHGAYTTMPQPLFGAQDVCYIEKRWRNKEKDGFLRLRTCTQACLPKTSFSFDHGPFAERKLTPRSRKSGHGLF